MTVPRSERGNPRQLSAILFRSRKWTANCRLHDLDKWAAPHEFFSTRSPSNNSCEKRVARSNEGSHPLGDWQNQKLSLRYMRLDRHVPVGRGKVRAVSVQISRSSPCRSVLLRIIKMRSATKRC